MAQTIKIKRSTGSSLPGSLSAGELAYTGGSGTQANNGSRLLIGNPADGSILVIGGKYFADMLDHAGGTLTASSAIIVDANSKIDSLKSGNIVVTGSTDTISTSSGNLTIAPTANLVITHGGTIDLDGQANEILIPDNQASAVNFTESTNSYLKLVTTNGSESVNIGKDLKIVTDGDAITFGADSEVSLTHVHDAGVRLNSTMALQFRDSALSISSSADGQLDIDADTEVEITAPTVDINGDVDVSGTLTTANLDVNTLATLAGARVENLSDTQIPFASDSNGTLSGHANLTFNDSTNVLAVTGKASVDNVDIDQNTISISDTTNSGNLLLTPNTNGVVKVPAGYKDRTQFDANTLVTKEYADSIKQSLDVKQSVRAATTANITIATALNNGDTIDGVTLATGDRVLVKDQSTGSENGIYVVGATPARADDADTSADVTAGMFVFVTEGTANGDNGFILTTNDTITLGTTALTFTQFSGAGQITAGDGLTKSGNTLSVNADDDTIGISGDLVGLKGLENTAMSLGDLLIGTSGAGFKKLSVGSATALLAVNSSGTDLEYITTLDGGTF
tara:strand:- start:1139 stop:2842 length:1704 start_codon:yes stop_codon:yes gene_type:complete